MNSGSVGKVVRRRQREFSVGWAHSYRESFFGLLAKETFALIVSYLDDVSSLSSSCTHLRLTLPQSYVLSFKNKIQLNSQYNDPEEKLYDLIPQLDSSLLAITVSVTWKDQGWGNQKGSLSLRLYCGQQLIAKQNLFPVAPHDWETKTVTLLETSHVISRSVSGDRLELWKYVGGGGGHTLHIRDLKFRFVLTSLIEDTKRTEDRETQKKNIIPFYSFLEKVKDNQFQSFSEWDFKNRTHSCHFCRLDSFQPTGRSSAWCAGANDANQWIQIDLLLPHRFTSIVTQGRGDCDQWVSKYRLGVSLDGKEFGILNNGNIFSGNSDNYSHIIHELEEEAKGRYLRLYPVSWVNHISLRWAVLAEPLEDSEVLVVGENIKKMAAAHLLRLQVEEESKNRYINFMNTVSNSQFSASSEWDFANRTHACYFCRLDSVQPSGCSSAWCAGSNDTDQWLQIDFLKHVTILSIVTQPRQDYQQWVTKYRLGVSEDGENFKFLKDGNIFEGNSDPVSLVSHDLFHTSGRYLRIYPLEWYGHISLRFGVYCV